jgi:ribosomal protein L24E
MKPFLASVLLFVASVQLIAFTPLRADNTPADKADQKTQVSVCIVSGEHLQPGEIVTYVYKEDGKPDRTIRLCCRKCVARFKADPERYLKKLDRLEAGSKTADKEKADQ